MSMDYSFLRYLQDLLLRVLLCFLYWIISFAKFHLTFVFSCSLIVITRLVKSVC